MGAEGRWEESHCLAREETQVEQDRAALLARHEFELAKESTSRGKIRWTASRPELACRYPRCLGHHILSRAPHLLAMHMPGSPADSKRVSSALPKRWGSRVLPTVYIPVRLTVRCVVYDRRPRPGHYPIDFSSYRMTDAKTRERHDPCIALSHR